MDRITKHDLYRRLNQLNLALSRVDDFIGYEAYGLSWSYGGVRITSGEGDDVGRRGTKRDIYDVLGGMCHVASRPQSS
jgi:hypothetical protein